MLEATQELLLEVEPLLDAGEADSAGKLLCPLDKVSLRAIFLHVLEERGTQAAEALGAAYLEHCQPS